jgi:hypothetical protein
MEEGMSVHTRLVVELLALAACAIVASSAAQAVDNIRYVSINGSNANPCTLVAPCFSLQTGINATPTGGELRILDSGFYSNSATVNRSMTISGNGNTVFLQAIITVDAPDAMVTLRDLTLNGRGLIARGISIAAAAAVHIERCVIHNFTTQGIDTTAEEVQVFVIDTVSRDNGAGFKIGGAGSRVTIDNSRFDNNTGFGIGTGVTVLTGQVTISRSMASGNSLDGIVSLSGSVSITSTMAAHNGASGFAVTSAGTMTVEASVAHANAHGLLVHSVDGLARISNSTFTENSVTGVNNFGGTVETRRNNIVRGNGIDLFGNALTFIGGV